MLNLLKKPALAADKEDSSDTEECRLLVTKLDRASICTVQLYTVHYLLIRFTY